MKNFFLFFFLCLLWGRFESKAQEITPIPAEPPPKSNPLLHPKGNFTFFWGYNRGYFSNSDIHFSGPDYNFTLHNLKAKDRPVPFAANTYFNPQRMWVPQNNYRLGYFFSDRLYFTLGIDHMKYVIVENQTATISGNVSAKASEKYKGKYSGDEILVTNDLLRFEHTNGFNLLSFESDFSQTVYRLFKNKISLALFWGAGFGVFIPKSEVYVFDYGLDNRFHLAGYSFDGKIESRINFLKRFFLSADLKGGYANLPTVLIHNDAPYRASHSLWFFEYYAGAGVYFKPGKERGK